MNKINLELVLFADQQFILLFLLIFLSTSPASFGKNQPSSDTQKTIRNVIGNANNLMARQLFSQALEEYQKCLDIDPGNTIVKANIVLLHNNWGIAHFHKEEYQLAKAEWEEALKLSPNDHNARNNIRILEQTLTQNGLNLNSLHNAKLEETGKGKEESDHSAIILLTPATKGNSHQKSFQDADTASEVSLPGYQTSATFKAPLTDISEKHSGVEILPGSDHSMVMPTEVKESTISNSTAKNAKLDQPMLPVANGEAQSGADDAIGTLERKIYGRALTELPIMKRLEKMELDSFGQISSAPIKERVSSLQKFFDSRR